MLKYQKNILLLSTFTESQLLVVLTPLLMLMTVQRCAKCKVPYYCGSTCQRAAWKLGHKVECKYLTSVAPRVPPPLVLLLLRTLQRASINPAYKETLPYGSRGLTDLWAHEKKIEKSEERREAFLAYLPVVAACVGDKYTQADLWINYCRYVNTQLHTISVTFKARFP